jgi:hypothetical protein
MLIRANASHAFTLPDSLPLDSGEALRGDNMKATAPVPGEGQCDPEKLCADG